MKTSRLALVALFIAVLVANAQGQEWKLKPNRGTDYNVYDEFIDGLVYSLIKWSPTSTPLCLHNGITLGTTAYKLFYRMIT